MKKKLLSALLLTTGLGFLNAQTINDFETGLSSVSGLTFRNQNSVNFTTLNCDTNPLFGSSINPPFTTFNELTEKATIVMPNMEPTLAGYGVYQSMVGPNGGRFAIRLNDNVSGNGDITSFEQPFVPTGTFLSFDYMVVLDSEHISDQTLQPFFTARLLDSQDNIIQGTQFCLIANPGDPLLAHLSPDLYYSPTWYSGMINIPQEYVGENIKVQFIAADCGQLGHIGSAYIDNIVNAPTTDPEYGFINLDHLDYDCSPQYVTVCGTYSAPKDSYLSAIQLDILQNGVSLGLNPAFATLSSITANTFCFDIDFTALGFTPTGNYEFAVISSFTSSINGYTYTLTDESTNIGADVSFNSTTAPVTYIDFAEQTITWPDTGGPYYIEFVTDGQCCPLRAILQPQDGLSYPFLTYNNSVSFYDGMIPLESKCLRFRVRSSCSNWTPWCCITTYNEGAGGYDTPPPGESYDCVGEVNFTNIQGRTAMVYPNTTTGKVTILNSNSLNFELYDYNNVLVLSKKISKAEEKVELDLSNLKQGIYILKTDKEHSIKIIKN